MEVSSNLFDMGVSDAHRISNGSGPVLPVRPPEYRHVWSVPEGPPQVTDAVAMKPEDYALRGTQVEFY